MIHLWRQLYGTWGILLGIEKAEGGAMEALALLLGGAALFMAAGCVASAAAVRKVKERKGKKAQMAPTDGAPLATPTRETAMSVRKALTVASLAFMPVYPLLPYSLLVGFEDYTVPCMIFEIFAVPLHLGFICGFCFARYGIRKKSHKLRTALLPISAQLVLMHVMHPGGYTYTTASGAQYIDVINVSIMAALLGAASLVLLAGYAASNAIIGGIGERKGRKSDEKF
jgi:hypothetical protein